MKGKIIPRSGHMVLWWLQGPGKHSRPESFARITNANFHQKALTMPNYPTNTPDFDAHLLAQHLSNDLKFDSTSRLWRRWDKFHWPSVQSEVLSGLVRDELLGLHYSLNPNPVGSTLAKHMAKCASSDYRKLLIQGMVERSEFRHSEWDKNEHAIACVSGNIDLRTGELTEPSREQYVTSMLNSLYDSHVNCSEWLELIDGWFSGDSERANYVQMAAGYTLLGDPREKIMLMCHGLSDTGKSTFLAMIATVLGHCVGHLPELWNASNTRGLINAFSRLQNSRIVLVPDAPEGMKWGTSELKTITGASDADHIISKKMHKDSTTYRPRFVVWAASNHLPQIKAEDESVWRRVRIIPFRNQKADSDCNKQLGKRARPDDPNSLAPQILLWMVEGTRKYLSAGRLPEVPLSMALAAESAKTQSQNTDIHIQHWISAYVSSATSDEFLFPSEVVTVCQGYAKSKNLPVPTSESICRVMASRFGAAKQRWVPGHNGNKGHNTRVYFGCRWTPECLIGQFLPGDDSTQWNSLQVN